MTVCRRLIYGEYVFSSLKFKFSAFNSVDRKKDRHTVKIWIVKLVAYWRLSKQLCSVFFVSKAYTVCTVLGIYDRKPIATMN